MSRFQHYIKRRQAEAKVVEAALVFCAENSSAANEQVLRSACRDLVEFTRGGHGA